MAPRSNSSHRLAMAAHAVLHHWAVKPSRRGSAGLAAQGPWPLLTIWRTIPGEYLSGALLDTPPGGAPCAERHASAATTTITTLPLRLDA
jgi:hypothetical protein